VRRQVTVDVDAEWHEQFGIGDGDRRSESRTPNCAVILPARSAGRPGGARVSRRPGPALRDLGVGIPTSLPSQRASAERDEQWSDHHTPSDDPSASTRSTTSRSGAPVSATTASRSSKNLVRAIGSILPHRAPAGTPHTTPADPTEVAVGCTVRGATTARHGDVGADFRMSRRGLLADVIRVFV
jgi:hypothetical protein